MNGSLIPSDKDRKKLFVITFVIFTLKVFITLSIINNLTLY